MISGQMIFKSGGTYTSGTFYDARRDTSSSIIIDWGGIFWRDDKGVDHGYTYTPSPWSFSSGTTFGGTWGATGLILVY
jgi:hypothetical protein